MWQIQKKYCCDLRQSVLPMFSSRSYMASALTFRSLPFGFTFVYSVRECSIFIILHVTIQFSWCMQGLFEPFEHLWWVWGLILNAISPLSTVLLVLLCHWTWGISSPSLQRLTQWNYEPCHAGPLKTYRLWWRVLAKCGSTGEGSGKPLQYFRTPWTIRKGKKIGYWKMNSPGW